ncbi:hypothetical protein [Pseudomonas phage vB_PsaM_M1]|nr:hypothetical protein [Pseudomonas phage vB_PsaM_M1]
MARHYVLGSWANADEFDYSGEQLMGHRQGKSICMDHMLPSGMANLKRYGDPVEQKPKVEPKAKLTAFEKVCTADRSYEKLCALSEELDNQLDLGEIDLESWSYARKQLDKKLERSWEAVKRLRGWTNETEQYPSQGLDFTLDLEHSKQRQYDYSVIPKHSVFSNLSDGNSIKIFYAQVLTAVNKVSKLWNVGKQILEEGLT